MTEKRKKDQIKPMDNLRKSEIIIKWNEKRRHMPSSGAGFTHGACFCPDALWWDPAFLSPLPLGATKSYPVGPTDRSLSWPCEISSASYRQVISIHAPREERQNHIQWVQPIDLSNVYCIWCRYLGIDAISCTSCKRITSSTFWKQVTGKLNYAQIGIYFI